MILTCIERNSRSLCHTHTYALKYTICITFFVNVDHNFYDILVVADSSSSGGELVSWACRKGNFHVQFKREELCLVLREHKKVVQRDRERERLSPFQMMHRKNMPELQQACHILCHIIPFYYYACWETEREEEKRATPFNIYFFLFAWKLK